jgi:hypothetical protein
MKDERIRPEKITKPIQLLAVWLIGLIAIETSLLAASATITKPEWLPVFFGISAVAIIPLFLFLIFLLQTKYRPQIQEDEYYSKYLDKNTMQFIQIDKNNNPRNELIKQETKKLIEETKKSINTIKESVDKDEKKETIENIIISSDNKIKNIERIIKYATHNLWINNTLDNFSLIVEKIKEIGFNSFKEFGNEKIPQNFHVSFTNTVNPIIIKEILIDLIPLGAYSIAIIDDEEAKRKNYGNAIFLGSYLYNNPNKTIINQKILNKISSLNEKSTINDLFKN